MPTNSPLTNTPMPELSDSPNIESATHPGFTTLERFSIPRFSTPGGRNSAFSGITPSVGQMVYIQSRGHLGYEVWDGSEWVEFGEYTRTRVYTAFSESHTEVTSATFTNISGLSLSVTEGIWRMETYIIYSTENSNDTNAAFNFTFPATSSSAASCGVIGRSRNATNLNPDTELININNNTNRASGDLEHEFGGNRGVSNEGLGNSTHAHLWGLFEVQSSGLLRAQIARRGSIGTVRAWRRSWMTVQRIG